MYRLKNRTASNNLMGVCWGWNTVACWVKVRKMMDVDLSVLWSLWHSKAGVRYKHWLLITGIVIRNIVLAIRYWVFPWIFTTIIIWSVSVDQQKLLNLCLCPDQCPLLTPHCSAPSSRVRKHTLIDDCRHDTQLLFLPTPYKHKAQTAGGSPESEALRCLQVILLSHWTGLKTAS